MLVGVIAASGLVAELAFRAKEQGRVEGVPFVAALAGSTDTVEIMLTWGDGQAFYAVARDPFLRHPEAFSDGASELAYRAQRPLVPYLVWLLSLGRTAWMGWVLVVVVVLGVGMAAGAATWLARGSRFAHLVGPLAVLTPGVLASVNGLQVESIGFGFAAIGVGRWRSGASTWSATLLFVAAVLTKETLVIVPAALVAYEMVVERKGVRPLPLVAVPAVAFVAWASVVAAVVGVGLGEGSGRLAAPLAGLAAVVGEWWWDEIVVAGIVVALLAGALVRAPRDLFTWIAVAHVPLAVVMDHEQWLEWGGYTRPLVPMQIFALIAIARTFRRTDAAAA